MDSSRVDKILIKIKNHPSLSLLIAIGIIVIALSTFTGALKNLISTVDDLVGSGKPVDITGFWKTEENTKSYLHYFDLNSVNGRLLGTVWVDNKFDLIRIGISNGKINENLVTFKTRHVFRSKFGRMNFVTGRREPDTMTESISYYEGTITGDKIIFIKQNDEGDARLIAIKTPGLIVKNGEIKETILNNIK